MINQKTAIHAYLNRQAQGNKKISERLRKFFSKACPELEEHMMMDVIFFGDRYYIMAVGDHVNLGIEVCTLTAKEKQNFPGEGNTMRHLTFSSESQVDFNMLSRLINMVESKLVES